jgi:hypothetical protein
MEKAKRSSDVLELELCTVNFPNAIQARRAIINLLLNEAGIDLVKVSIQLKGNVQDADVRSGI